MTADNFVNYLDSVTETANGWTARCPAHNDSRASLSIGQAEDRILIRCFAGCSAREIVESLGLHLRDLFTKTRA